MPALFADGFHGDRERFLLIAVHNSAFEHIDALSFRSSACCNEHLLGDIECLELRADRVRYISWELLV